MRNLKLLNKILRLKGMKLTHFEFKIRDKELHLTVKPHKNGCRCPECGRLMQHACAVGSAHSVRASMLFACGDRCGRV